METADLLLGAGADANAANDFRMTPLSEACTNGNAAFVRLLLKSGANPNTPIATGETPLMTCAKTGSADAVRMLIEYGAAVNAKEPTQNQTALMWAAAERHPDVVKALIDAHADLKAHTKQGFTADSLRGARRRPGKRKVVAGRGSGRQHPDAGRGRGKPCPSQLGLPRLAEPRLHSTAGGGGAGQVDLALYLLDHGADPNIDAAGFTPLHWASTSGKAYARIRCTVLKTPCPAFRIARPSCGW